MACRCLRYCQLWIHGLCHWIEVDPTESETDVKCSGVVFKFSWCRRSVKLLIRQELELDCQSVFVDVSLISMAYVKLVPMRSIESSVCFEYSLADRLLVFGFSFSNG